MEIGLALGSNMGDRLNNLKQARDKIGRIKDVVIVAQSPVYETEPVDVVDEFADMAFLNAVVVVEFGVDVGRIAELCVDIEHRMGRAKRCNRNGPRIIDIDIIYAGNAVIRDGTLVVPHPRWASRRFVVEPLAVVRAELLLPGAVKSVADILKDLPVTPKVAGFCTHW